MKRLLIPFLCLLVIQSCKKSLGDDLSGTRELKGTLYYNDTLRGVPEEILLRNQTIEVKNPADSNNSNYIYRTTTNDQGSFSFTNLSDKDYVLHAEKTVNNLLFSAKVLVRSSVDTSVRIVLYPDTATYNILNITTLDNATNGRLFNAKVCVFTSALLAQNNQCDGSFFSGTTDAQGRILLTRLLPGIYYINAQLISGAINISKKGSIDIKRATGIYSITLLLN